MKQFKLILISAAALFSLIIAGCEDTATPKANTQTKKTEEKAEKPAKIKVNKAVEIAYNSLGDEEKQEIEGDWKDAEVSKAVANTRRFGLSDPSFDGKEVAEVTFRSKNSDLLGDIIRIVDEKSGKVVGAGFRG